MLNGVSRFVSTLTSTSVAHPRQRPAAPRPDEVLHDDYDFCGPTPEEVEAASKELQTLLTTTDSAPDPNEAVITDRNSAPDEVVVTDREGPSISKVLVTDRDGSPISDLKEVLVTDTLISNPEEVVITEVNTVDTSVPDQVLVTEVDGASVSNSSEVVITEDVSARDSDGTSSSNLEIGEAASTRNSDGTQTSSSSREVLAVATAGNQSCISQRSVQQKPPAAVVQCVDLFQRDPDVQAAVMSLTRDPAVWNAFVRNEKVQELLRGNREKRLTFAGVGSSLELLQYQHTNPFLVAVHCLKNTAYEALDTLVDAVHGVFGFFDRKLFGGRESEPVDRPLKACMVLTILLFSLVLLRRGRC